MPNVDINTRGRNSEHSHSGPLASIRQRRWGLRNENVTLGLSTAITSTMTSEQLDAYVDILHVEEITEQLRADQLDPTNRPRSPSPPPEYDGTGRRTNTWEQRYRKFPEEERQQLVETAMRTIPAYRPPYDYPRPVARTSEKIYLPATGFQSVDLIGQVLGPRSSSLKTMKAESSANIAPRGRGSVKEGEGRARLKTADHDREPVHCLVTADSQLKVGKAKSSSMTLLRQRHLPPSMTTSERSTSFVTSLS
ncbi:Branchpoint-bridging protein [Fusarium keratoplasticum]|uniref:Branchpoint-bridging protein n=1 Tax=Fusarium keratoplasticum TaxID=1328300 RepID=A0ACC0QPC0_9HYPO|nr:Branchpoint-bridging protein [Fusarium keratoplasticum]KAI8657850.1 Branchpoint-bridging protein [Fusarium keratoplasticum]